MKLDLPDPLGPMMTFRFSIGSAGESGPKDNRLQNRRLLNSRASGSLRNAEPGAALECLRTSTLFSSIISSIFLMEGRLFAFRRLWLGFDTLLVGQFPEGQVSLSARLQPGFQLARLVVGWCKVGGG